MNRLTKRIILNILLIIAIGGGILFGLLSHRGSQETFVEDNFNKLYDAKTDIEAAIRKIQVENSASTVIEKVNTVERVTAITFEGMLDQDTADKLLNLLDTYNAKTYFFFPGIKAAEDADTVKTIAASGQNIGNYTLSALKQMEQYDTNTLIEDFCQTNVILNDITGSVPTFLKANGTYYSKELLQAANASGLFNTVSSDYYLNYQSFSSKKDAEEFVKGIEKGSIISIKTDSPLDESEYVTTNMIKEEIKDITTAEETEEATIQTIETNQNSEINLNQESEMDKNEKLLLIVEYLLQALEEQNYTLVPVDTIPLYDDPAFTLDFATERADNKGKLAKVYKKMDTSLLSVAYTFRGIGNEDILDKILVLLEENNIKATFFVTGEEVLQYKEQINKIMQGGHNIGNGGLTGTSLDNKTYLEVCFEIYKTKQLLQEYFNITTKLFMPAYGKYNDTIREAAAALGYDLVTYNKNAIKTDNTTVLDSIRYFENGFMRGDIVYFHLGYTDSIVKIVDATLQKTMNEGYAFATLKDLLDNPFVIKPPLPNKTVSWNKPLIMDDSDSKENQKNNPITSENPTTDESDFNTPQEPPLKKENSLTVEGEPKDYKRLRLANNGQKAELLTNLYTTQPAVSYVFRGISNSQTLDETLLVLEKLKAKATFFVTGKEIQTYKENVDKIIANGHQLGNGGYGMDNTNPSLLDFETLCYDIDMGERYLKAYLGERYEEDTNKYYMPLYADVNEFILEAAKTLGYKQVVTYNRSVMTTKYKDMTADEIIAQYFSNTTALYRGDVVYFRLDYLTQEGAIQELIQKTAIKYIKKAPYDIVTVDELAANDLVYTPVSRADAIGADLIQKSFQHSLEILDSLFIKNYIGNPFVNSAEDLFGFTEDEIAHIDTSGKIDTKGEKIIFLTFDDWGYDDNITQLLNVLKKYNVQSTFFVRVGNEKLTFDSPFTNPNLLRAIALEGHDVANHTFQHMKINITTEEEKVLLQEDLFAAHQEMARYIGDTKSLKLIFRPPTLAVSKLGLETVFDCGFKYIVNGDFSTHDYEAKSAEQLIDRLINGINEDDSSMEVTKDTPEESILRIEAGSIVVMHMSEDAKYTPEALDVVIPYYMEQGYRFEKLSDYLNLQ